MGFEVAVDTINMAPETGFVGIVKHSTEIGGEPAVGDIGVVGRPFSTVTASMRLA